MFDFCLIWMSVGCSCLLEQGLFGACKIVILFSEGECFTFLKDIDGVCLVCFGSL